MATFYLGSQFPLADFTPDSNLVIAATDQSTVSFVVNTAAGGTDIQWTSSAGGNPVQWISGWCQKAGGTLSSTLSATFYVVESDRKANAVLRVRFYHLDYQTGVYTLIGGPWDDTAEIPISLTARTISGTPTSTTFEYCDRLVCRAYITNTGTMAAGYTCTITHTNGTGRCSMVENDSLTWTPTYTSSRYTPGAAHRQLKGYGESTPDTSY